MHVHAIANEFLKERAYVVNMFTIHSPLEDNSDYLKIKGEKEKDFLFLYSYNSEHCMWLLAL